MNWSVLKESAMKWSVSSGLL